MHLITRSFLCVRHTGLESTLTITFYHLFMYERTCASLWRPGVTVQCRFPQCHPDEMFALCPSHYNISSQPLSVWQFFSLGIMKKPPHLDISKVKQCLLNNLLSSSVGAFLKQNLFTNLELSSSAQLLASEPQETCLSPSPQLWVYKWRPPC